MPTTEAPRPVLLSAPRAPGTALPPSPDPSLDEAYKLVTVLCCAVTDAPTLAAHLRPEATYRLMQAFFARAQEVIQRYDGTMTHVTSEGFTAVFGAPVGQEDHARRAVLAALELAQHLRLPPLGDVHVARMGVHTGPVVVGQLASTLRQHYTAVGDTMHQALGLQHLATPGTMLISAATYRLVQEEVQVDVAGTSPVEGQGVPIPVYRLQGLTQRRAGVSGHGRRHPSRFVGREREVAFLHERLAHVAQGHGQVVGIVGDPGMGKTRLLAEFRRGLGGQPVTYREGHCFPYSHTIPYLPVRDLLRQACGITDADGVEAITAKARQYLADAHLMAEDDTPLLLQILDVPVDDAQLVRFSPEERKARVFALLRHLVMHDCRHHPLVLAVENLHWIDATSEAWLTALVEHLAGAAILLLVTHRPGYRPPWLAQSVATQMALAKLLPEDSLAVVQSVLQTTTLPEPLLQTIVTQAAGNPFFLEELTWAVMEQSPHPAVPVIPDTIQAVLTARIDRLPPAERRLLQTAAVIGTEIAVPLLLAIAELPVETVRSSLTHLQAAEFLYETRLFPELVYTFKHALTHEVAYGCLLRERRRTLHARIVEVLETRWPDRIAEQIERLAHHALRGEVWAKAMAYCQQAGEKAMARSAHHEAVAYYEQGLTALAHLPEQHDLREQAIDLLLALRSALLLSGDSARILTSLREAEALAVALDDQRRLGQISVFLSFHYYYRGAHDQAIVASQRALAIATAGGDVVLHALAHQPLGVAYQAQGDYRRAIDCFRQTVTAFDGRRRFERSGHALLPAVLSRAWLAACHAELGTFAEGRTLGEEGLQIAEVVDHPGSLTFAAWGSGLLSLRQGDLSRALPLLARALDLCQNAALTMYFPWMATALGMAYTLSGRVADAVTLLTQAMEQSMAIETEGYHAFCSLSLGEAQLLAGRLEEAHALAEQALRLARAHQERGHQAYALRLLGEIAAHREPLESESAETHYRQALALAGELGMRPLVAHCHRSLGMLNATTGQAEQAHAALSTAIEMYRDMAMTFWLPETQAALAQVEG